MSISTGTRIKKVREFRNYTQEYMSEKLKISQNTYSRYESGSLRLDSDRLQDISKILEVPIETLLNEERQTFNSYLGQHAFYAEQYVNQSEGNKALEKRMDEIERLFAKLQKENERLRKSLETSRSR